MLGIRLGAALIELSSVKIALYVGFVGAVTRSSQRKVLKIHDRRYSLCAIEPTMKPAMAARIFDPAIFGQHSSCFAND